jgi:hypothetical protein
VTSTVQYLLCHFSEAELGTIISNAKQRLTGMPQEVPVVQSWDEVEAEALGEEGEL